MSTPAEPTNIERTRALLRRPLSPLDLAENTRAVAARGDVRSGPSRSLLVFVLGGERLGLEADDAGRVAALDGADSAADGDALRAWARTCAGAFPTLGP